MNAISLTSQLIGNREYIETILTELGYSFTFDRSKESYRFARKDGQNPTSTVLSLNSLNYYCFSNRNKGSLYSLVMENKAIGYAEAVQWIAHKLGFDESTLDAECHYPFGGFYHNIYSPLSMLDDSYIDVVDESELIPYQNKFNMMFLKDGISFDSQKKFGVGYDDISNRIAIPIRTIDGKLYGIMGRLNDLNCEKSERWLPIIPCSRSLTLYGYYQNYLDIKQKNIAVVGESEKFVMQLDSFGSHIGLATGGNKISKSQAQILQKSFIDRIILAYDEGLEEEYIRNEAYRISLNTPIYSNKIGYIFDKENKYLKAGSKDSPSDHGKEIFTKLIKECVVWL